MCGQPTSLIFDAKRLKGGLKIDVRDSSGEKLRHTTEKRPDGTTEILFQPLYVGIYSIAVEFNNKHVIGKFFIIRIFFSFNKLIFR